MHATQSPAFSSGKTLTVAPSAQNARPEARRRWTTAELTETIAALATARTADIAKVLGVNPKALRSVLRRNGISLRALRQQAASAKIGERCGFVIRRSALAPSARFGAEALVELADGACRWPLGDPAEPDFAFCGDRALASHAYCASHFVCAFERRNADAR